MFAKTADGQGLVNIDQITSVAPLSISPGVWAYVATYNQGGSAATYTSTATFSSIVSAITAAQIALDLGELT